MLGAPPAPAARVNDINEGWERRSRSSGGFPAAPLCVFFHHTASSASVSSDLNYMIHNCPDAPVGNMLLDRSGIVWPIAAGASNCAGKGGPQGFSRGTIPQDQGNTHGWQIEAANNGVGEVWPNAQIDAYFKASNALNELFGNLPTDITGHAHYTPGRKIDPATAMAVDGGWQPGSINTSGTWNLDDIRNECARRAGTTPAPQPPNPGPITPIEEDDMASFLIRNADTGTIALITPGVDATPLDGNDLDAYMAKFGAYLDTTGPVFDDFFAKANR